MSKRLVRVFVRIVGTPPGRGASAAAKLVWTRRLYLSVLPGSVLVYVLAALIEAPRWLWAVLIVGAGAWLLGFAQVNVQIWRERHRRPPGPAA